MANFALKTNLIQSLILLIIFFNWKQDIHNNKVNLYLNQKDNLVFKHIDNLNIDDNSFKKAITNY